MRNNSVRSTWGLTQSMLLAALLLTVGCTSTPVAPPAATAAASSQSDYIIGPGDELQIFVWRNPEISTTVPVRPDGKISTPLVDDMPAVGKTPSQLARDIEQALSRYLKKPIATVTVNKFVGNFNEQIRVVGQAAEPRALQYRDDMTILDVMIEVGGLTEFAAGNRAQLIRRTDSGPKNFNLRLADLINNGDMTANLKMQPGDIVIIPESWF